MEVIYLFIFSLLSTKIWLYAIQIQISFKWKNYSSNTPLTSREKVYFSKMDLKEEKENLEERQKMGFGGPDSFGY